MTRFCDSCRRQRPLRDFDLGGGQLSSTCLSCAHERTRTEDREARLARHVKIAALEKERRTLIAALVKLDAEIAERASAEDRYARHARHAEIAELERRRRSLIAALVKLDAEIADLRATRPVDSTSFALVEPSDIFDGADADPADADLVFGD